MLSDLSNLNLFSLKVVKYVPAATTVNGIVTSTVNALNEVEYKLSVRAVNKVGLSPSTNCSFVVNGMFMQNAYTKLHKYHLFSSHKPHKKHFTYTYSMHYRDTLMFFF